MMQSDKMSDKAFFDALVDERIRLTPHNRHNDEKGELTISEGEKTIDSLNEKDREKIMTYLDMITDDMAEYERTAYIRGMKDGILLTKAIYNLRCD